MIIYLTNYHFVRQTKVEFPGIIGLVENIDFFSRGRGFPANAVRRSLCIEDVCCENKRKR